MGFAAKKSLGQHFLFNPSTIDKILDCARIQKSDRVLEIGPGPGAMTRRLVKRAGLVLAVEKDHRFATVLHQELGSENFQILEEDFLSLSLEKALSCSEQRGQSPVSPGTGWKVVANLPYNIATETIFHLLEFNSFFSSFHLMVQREVADRLVAKPGSKDYGILSIFTQLFSENKIVMKLPPGAFSPPPKVHSAVVSFKVSEECRFPIHHLPTFESVVRISFSQRRKMIRNSLRELFSLYPPSKIEEALKKAGVQPTQRPETIPIEGFAVLSNKLARDEKPLSPGASRKK